MTLSKRTFLNIIAAGMTALALPLSAQAADIKAMAESLVNLTIKAPDGTTFDFTLPTDALKKAAGKPSTERAIFYAQQFEVMMKSKMRDIPDGTSSTLSGSIAKALDGEDRLTEHVWAVFGGTKFGGELRIHTAKK